jgi:holliday junction DNA helicase RuvA
MIVHLEGVLAEKHPTRIVIDCAGVGYEVFIPLSSYDRLPAQEARCRLHIHHHVREDAEVLYGFASTGEREMFERLLAVSGIGPRIALKTCVVGNDIKRLSSVPGIGKKTAERLVVELRHKIGAAEALEALAGADGAPMDARARDAALALVQLGYKQAEAYELVREILKSASPGDSVEDIIRRALAR